MLTNLTFLFLGLGLLTLGAELLVRGASRLAAAAGISPLVIGLTVVAYGTSAPELVVSTHSALSGQSDIALGNVIGSNIFNILFILGISALIHSLAVSSRLVIFDVPLLIGSALAVMIMAADGGISRGEGAFLFAGSLLYTGYTIRAGRTSDPGRLLDSPERTPGKNFKILPPAGSVVLGLIFLVLGSHWLVQGAVAVAQSWGVSTLIIGLTIVAAGTSLPEAATSVVAAIHRERDIAVGNIVGSNIFNLLVVLGFAAALNPGGIRVSPAAFSFDLPIMVTVCVACLPIFFTDHAISRGEGALFFGYYLVYIGYLYLKSGPHESLLLVNRAMVMFVIPLTALTLFVLSVRYYRRWRREGSSGGRKAG